MKQTCGELLAFIDYDGGEVEQVDELAARVERVLALIRPYAESQEGSAKNLLAWQIGRLLDGEER